MSRDPVQTNVHIFRVYQRRLSNPADQRIFIGAANKLAAFLDNRRAYYAEAQQPIVELLEVALNSLKNVAPDVFRKSDFMNRSLIPPEQAPLFNAFDQLANSVTPYIHLFTDESLSNRLRSFFSFVNIPLSSETQNLESFDASTQISTPRSTVSQITAPTRNTPPSSSITESGASLAELPARGEIAMPPPDPAPASSMTVENPPSSASGFEETASPMSDEVTVDHEVVVTPTQQAPTSAIPSRQSPPSHAPISEAAVSTALVEPNSAPPPPSLHTQTLSPISDPQVAPASLQKIAPSPSASRLDIPASTSSANIPHAPKPQALQLLSKSPPPDGVVQAPRNALLSLARAHASGSAPVSVSSASTQVTPKPPARRQSSGLDFLQLDLQVARERRQRAVAEAAISGSVVHASSPTSSTSGRGTPATTVAVANAGAPSTPVLSRSSPIVAQGTPPLEPSILRTSSVNPRTAVSSESDDLSVVQPQTAASRPIHVDLRQRSNRSGSGTPSTPKLQITDRGPAPPPEPGSLAAPIVIDEDDEAPVSEPAEDKMEVDVPADALPHVEPCTVLGFQDSRGEEESVRPENLLGQDVSAPQSTSCVLVPKAKPAASAPDAVFSAQKSSVPCSSPFPPLSTSSRITSVLPPPVSTTGSETQDVSSPRATESKEPHGEKGGKDLLNEDVKTTGVVAEGNSTTTTLPQIGGERETTEVSVECGDVAVVSGTTIEKPSGGESTLDKVSPQTAVGVMAVLETGNTETTAPIAAMTESSLMLEPSTDEFIRTLMGMISSESGPSLDAQVPNLHSAADDKKYSRRYLKSHSNAATGEHPDGASIADVPPASGKHRRSPTPDGDARRVLPRKSSSAPTAERRQDLLSTPVLSNFPHPTTPVVTISPAAQHEDVSERTESPSSSFKSSVYQEPNSGNGRASISLSVGPHKNSSLSDMDVSRSSVSPPPIVFLKPSEGPSGTNSTNSRSASPLAGGKASEGVTEDDEMVDELAPLFGRDMRVLSMFRPYDIAGEFTLDFVLLDSDWEKISLWVRAPTNIDLDISQAKCISLACYSVQDLEPYTTQQAGSRENWFENVRPVPWLKMPRHIWFLVNDEFTILYPPYEADMELLDVSPYLRPGQNKIAFTQIDSMADYVLVLHGHYPTSGQIAPVHARWDERKRFREKLAWLARPISPTI